MKKSKKRNLNNYPIITVFQPLLDIKVLNLYDIGIKRLDFNLKSMLTHVFGITCNSLSDVEYVYSIFL